MRRGTDARYEYCIYGSSVTSVHNQAETYGIYIYIYCFTVFITDKSVNCSYS